LRGAQKLLFDIIDQPDIVLQAMMQIRKLYPIIYDAFYGYGNKKKLGTTVPWHFYSRGKCQWVQADFICLLTPDMVRKFVLPAIEEEAFFLDHCCFHLDGPGALAHLDEILAIEKIHAIGWVPGEGNKPQIEWEDLFHKIQNAGKTVLLYGEPEQIKAVHGKYKPDLVFTHYWKEYMAHRNVASIASEAFWQAGWICSLDLGEPWKAAALYHFEVIQMLEEVSHIIDITDTYEDKLKAMTAYKSQCGVVSGALHQIEGKALARGSQAGIRYGEALYRNNTVPRTITGIQELL